MTSAVFKRRAARPTYTRHLEEEGEQKQLQQGMYKEGVRRMRTSPVNNAEERAVRESRRDEKELQECTFQPNLLWKNKQKGCGRKSKIVMEPNIIHRRQVNPPRPISPPPPLPLEIYITRQTSFDTPPRDQKEGNEENVVSSMGQFPFGFPLSPHPQQPMVRSDSITASAGACTDYGSI